MLVLLGFNRRHQSCGSQGPLSLDAFWLKSAEIMCLGTKIGSGNLCMNEIYELTHSTPFRPTAFMKDVSVASDSV